MKSRIEDFVAIEGRPSGGLTAVDIKVWVPEWLDVGSFWLRAYATHHTFADLHHECINHPSIRASRHSLARTRASRHFWLGDRLMLRRELVAEGLPELRRSSGEISLVLRPGLLPCRPRPVSPRGP